MQAGRRLARGYHTLNYFMMATLSQNSELTFPDCPVRNVLDRIGDKWSLLVLLTLDRQAAAPLRFNELMRAIPDISQKMLTAVLRTLEADGYVSRKAYPVVPPRVEYTLTERTHSLLPLIKALVDWAKDNMNDIKADRRRYQLKAAK